MVSLLLPSSASFDGSSIVALAVSCFGILLYRFARHRSRPPFPPGPKGLPILGNIRDVPMDKEWLTYTQWAKEYGPIVSVHVLGQRVVLVNSADLCRELFESRSSIYSNRPSAPMLNMMGYGEWLVGLLQPGQQWTSCRKVMSQALNPQAVQQWRAYEVQAIHGLLVKLLDDPENFSSHIDRSIVGFFMKTLYGHQIPASGEDEFLAIHNKSLHESGRAITSGAYLVNIFPSFRHIPEWMIGGGFQKDAKDAFATCQEILHRPMAKIKQEMAEGKEAVSYVSTLLAESRDEFVIKQTAATSYNAGVTGTKCIFLTSFLIMTLYPEAQCKAQEEIQKHCGKDTLPTHKDRASLPYTEAFVKELFRLAPPAPVGLPRSVAKDDVIRGYFIPAGSLVIFNTWSVLHDENHYARPFEFRPERHLDANGRCPDTTLEGFGFGKRVCPGRHAVDEFTWLAVACVLAAFDVRKAIDANGKPITPKQEFSPGLFSAPMPFQTSITPHSSALEERIRRMVP